MKLYSCILLLFVLSLAFQLVTAQEKGKSIKEKKVNTRFENGTIRGGYKTGLWNYYDKPGELSLTVDYTTGYIRYLKKDTAGVYAIQKNGIWLQSRLDIQPRYIGSVVDFYTILMKNIRYPSQARHKNTQGTIYVTFEIDTTGKANNFSIAKNIGDNCAEEVIRVLQLVPKCGQLLQKTGNSINPDLWFL
jgi:hypothetical protein